MLQEISYNVANFNASQMVAALSAHSSYRSTAAPTQEDQCQSTGNTQTLASVRLGESESGGGDQHGSFGGSFGAVKAEVQSNLGGNFVTVCREDVERNAEHEEEDEDREQQHPLIE